MKRSRILHGRECIAFENETWNSHEHGEEVMIERLGIFAEESRPDFMTRTKSKDAADVEPRRHDEFDQTAAVETQDASPVFA